jgi:Uma2 family endonuclease
MERITMSTIARFSVKEYERIVATGVFGGKNRRRIELIRGELREMNPIGPEHADIVAWLTAWSLKAVAPDSISVRVQSPIALGTAESEPEPDIVWVGPKRFLSGHPTPNEVLLLIEVAESSLDFDRGEKADMYAEAGISDYWIVNLEDRTVEVRRDPKGGGYRSLRTFGGGETVQPLAASDARLIVDSLFAES